MTVVTAGTTALADVLALHGRRGWLSPPLLPFCAPDAPVAGEAVTVRISPGPPPGGGALDPLYELLSTDLAGTVLVVAGAEAVEGAVWGQILSRAARSAGALAAVVAGAVRDRAWLDGERLPVWGLVERTVGAVGMAHVNGTNVEVEVAGVTVSPGDRVTVDGAGVVTVPAAFADAVAAQAARYLEGEDAVLRDLAAGGKLADAYRHKRRAVAEIEQAPVSSR